jgi:hypothetical protein
LARTSITRARAHRSARKLLKSSRSISDRSQDHINLKSGPVE